jgi:hypothetical protein
LCLLVCAVMLAPPVAAGQDRSPTPSADELWRTYPLQESPEPSGTLSPTASSRPAEAPPAPDDGAPLALIGAAGLLVALAGALALLRVRSRPPALAHRRWGAPLLMTAAATAMQPSQRPRSPRLTALGGGPSPWSGDSPEDAARPPDPRRAWIAEVQWIDPRFAVIARAGKRGKEVSVATSRPLPWPPSGPKAVREMSRAVERLEASMLAAGWTPLAPGSAWYAKRFAWAAPAPRDEQQSPAPVASVPRSGRFKRQTEWPAGSELLWRCEIKWHAGYANSDFRAVAHGPKRHRSVTLGHSETFKWLLKGDPAASDARFLGQVRLLADRLIAAGWEPAGRGPGWYELRFVWRRDGAPPEQLDPAPVEAGR